MRPKNCDPHMFSKSFEEISTQNGPPKKNNK